MTLVKRFPYRGDATEEFSNQYWFTGATPATAADWLALFTALTTVEKACYPSTVKIVRGYGYSSTADDAAAVYVRDLVPSATTIAGTLAAGGTGIISPGDAAGWIRWKTDRLTSKGKAIYLRKYFHQVYAQDSTANDTLSPHQATAYNTFAAKLWDGTFLDARKITGRGHTDTIVGASASPYITTRTLKRRPKRAPA
jgi:hypothetical protein